MSRNTLKWVKRIITFVAAYFVVVAKSNIDWNNLANNVVDIRLFWNAIYDLSIGVLSAMLLVWLIDEIQIKVEAKEAQEEEREFIKRLNRVVEMHINRYIGFYYCVATPITKRDLENACMPENFTLQDMYNLHDVSLATDAAITCSSVESFLKYELEIRKEFLIGLRTSNFTYHGELHDIISKYVDISLKYDCRDVILGNEKIYNGGEKLVVNIKKYLYNDADKYYSNVLNGAENNNYYGRPYVMLYEMMKQQRDIILRYQKALQELEKE